MPNAKILSEKQAIVASLTEKFQNAAAGVIVDYRGITVAEDTELRAKMRENGVEYFVVKNTLARSQGPGRPAQQRGPGGHRSGHPYRPRQRAGNRSGRQHLWLGPRDAGHCRPEGCVNAPVGSALMLKHFILLYYLEVHYYGKREDHCSDRRS